MLIAWIVVAAIALAALLPVALLPVALLPVALLLRRGEKLPVAIVGSAIALAVILPFGAILALFAGTDRESADGPLPVLAAALYLALPLALLCAALSWRMWFGLRTESHHRPGAGTRSEA